MHLRIQRNPRPLSSAANPAVHLYREVPMAEARIDRAQLERHVMEALRRIPDKDLIINGPVTVGIIAWPDGDRPDFRDIVALPRMTNS